MDCSTLKMAMAGFFHDIGKFPDKEILQIGEEYFNNQAATYLPSKNGRYTHYHAVYTVAFIELQKNYLPVEMNTGNWGEGDAFINLAAGHHDPQTPMQWCVAIADRVSSGWDRGNFENNYNSKVAWKDYQKTRLIPLFENLLSEKQAIRREDYSFGYPLEPVNPESIFPKKNVFLESPDISEAKKEYQLLYEKFVGGLKRLDHLNVNTELWFEHFESLCRVYTSCIPSARAGNVIPDISLYDHLKATSALAVAIFEYHRRTNSLKVENINDYKDQKFLIINGDFHGIQKFIFTGYADSGKYRSKILRGRSFAVSLFSELAADMLTREIGLPFSSVLINTAGKFTIIAPNTRETILGVKKVEQAINDWLIKNAYGEISIGISTVQACCNDFVSGCFAKFWERMVQKANFRKFSKFDLERYGGAVVNYLKSFNTNLKHSLCPICGKRPSEKIAENSIHIRETISSCGLCRDHVFLGSNLVKQERVSIYKADIENFHPDDCLLIPIFDAYQLFFEKGKINSLSDNKKLLKSWHFNIGDSDDPKPLTTLKLLSGYVPKYSKKDIYDCRIFKDEIESDEKTEILEQIDRGVPKTMNHIASTALDENKVGTEALGILKADVDNLGLLMACGLSPERFTLTRMATLSRQLDLYFSVYLPHLLATHLEFQNIYTVFAGGDDLFLIGPWNRIIDLAMFLRESFSQYVCKNKNIHFSAGITIQKPQTPVEAIAEATDKMLETSKNSGRERLTLFSQTVQWDNCPELIKIRDLLEAWLQDEKINKSLLYKLNGFIDMSSCEKEILENNTALIGEMHCMKWRSHLYYNVSRNAGKGIENVDERRIFVENLIAALTKWLDDFGGAVKIPLWYVLYNIR